MELDLEKTSQLQDGAKALDVLNDELDVLAEEHDYWQIVDLEIRHFKVILKENKKTELEIPWQVLQDKAKELYISSVEPWAVNIKKISEDLENAIAADNRGKIRQSFQRYSTEASQRFFKFDDQLNIFCGDLLDIDGPLASVLRMMNE